MPRTDDAPCLFHGLPRFIKGRPGGCKTIMPAEGGHYSSIARLIKDQPL